MELIQSKHIQKIKLLTAVFFLATDLICMSEETVSATTKTFIQQKFSLRSFTQYNISKITNQFTETFPLSPRIDFLRYTTKTP